jgi:branched-subunit amino acid ABC-type transport system permease component
LLIIQALGFGIITGSLIAIGAMGFTIQFGLTNVLNISYAGIMTAGAFAAFIAEELHLALALGVVLALAVLSRTRIGGSRDVVLHIYAARLLLR